ncbi:DUF7536 family protein [Halomicrobium katesii]|uniref:DUF7536 family protein n=1 Tax=Halomicrobium katesii TaxID=437163 RepID=UPI00036819C3|nr:hypothetical protein [Halomicrobium katesii]
MSESQPDTGPGALVAALNVPTHAKRGFFLAGLLTAAVFAFFVVIPGAQRPAVLYAGLAFVLFVSLGGLITAVFVAGSAIRQIRSL